MPYDPEQHGPTRIVGPGFQNRRLFSRVRLEIKQPVFDLVALLFPKER